MASSLDWRWSPRRCGQEVGLGSPFLFLLWGPRRPLFRMLWWEALPLVWTEEGWLQGDQSVGVYWGPQLWSLV